MCVAVGAVGLQGIALRGFTPVWAESEGWEESEAGGVCIGVVFQGQLRVCLLLESMLTVQLCNCFINMKNVLGGESAHGCTTTACRQTKNMPVLKVNGWKLPRYSRILSFVHEITRHAATAESAKGCRSEMVPT